MTFSKLHRGLFLDRDGVINIDVGHNSLVSNFNFMPNIFTLCQLAKKLDYKIIIVTNQSGIGRNLFSLDQYYALSDWMLSKFSENLIEIDLIMTSTLNPDFQSYSQFELFRRKPNPGLILDAIEILSLDPNESWLIGNKLTDIQAGESAGVKNLVLLDTVENDQVNFRTVPNLESASNLLMLEG